MNLFFFCDQKLIVWISFFKGCQQKIDGFGLGTVHRPYIAVYIFSIRDRLARMEIKTAGDFLRQALVLAVREDKPGKTSVNGFYFSFCFLCARVPSRK